MPNSTNNHTPATGARIPEEPNLFPNFPGMSQKDKDSFNVLDEPYKLGPDSLVQDGIPRGNIIKYHWASERIFPGTERDYWLYILTQYNGSQPACLMVFQDGETEYLGPNINVPVVFDNLINKRDMPVTIGLFVNPGDTLVSASWSV